MVRGFSGSLDRDQSFIPGCIDIPLFFILVIGTARGEEDSRFNQISVINPKVSFFFRIIKSSKRERIGVDSGLSETRNLVQGFNGIELIIP